MKQIALLYSQIARRLNPGKEYDHTSVASTSTLLAIITFFLIITAQLFWSTIHGDGAVYSWIVREVGEAGLFSRHLPNWDHTKIFAEHPYLFFYFSNLFTSWLGYSDLALKVPNFMIAIFSVALLWYIARRRDQHLNAQHASHLIGLITGYVLILNPNYIMQISQPSLDPMAQLLALAAAAVYILHRRAFFSGLLLGLAFLTKGLEMLPHLAALFLVVCAVERKALRTLFSQLAFGTVGLLLPLLTWLAYDQWIWSGQWLTTYWNRQFSERFFHAQNTQTFLQFDILLTFIQVYSVELLILAAGIIFARRWKRTADPFFMYFLTYVFFNLLAFMLIKKDSSQHLTGVLLFGALFVAEYLWALAQRLQWKFLRALPLTMFAIAFGYWSWFIFGIQKNPDIWTAIKTESTLDRTAADRGLPIVVHNTTPEAYGFFYTVQWYFPSQTVYSPEMANRQLIGRKVLLVADRGGKLQVSPVVYGQ